MYIAFYKAQFGNMVDKAINLMSGNKGYSHCEIVFSDGVSFSSTQRDASVDMHGNFKPDGTRYKQIDYKDNDHFDLILVDTSTYLEKLARDFCDSTLDSRYDFWGVARFVFPLAREHPTDYFCSEICTEVLTRIRAFKVFNTYKACFEIIKHKSYEVKPNDLAKILGVVK